ncbi:MAG: NAD(P)H-hydrate epimerase [Planctomycetota bacterium]|nr:NAD(P)H-hydrate epimerase [Planctomycetota bacterium]
MDALSRDEVRRVDRWAIEVLGLSGLVLMENAGRQVADAVFGVLGEARSGRVAVVAGAGNNGGDGFVAARHLVLRGLGCATFLIASPEKVYGDARVNLQALWNLNADVRVLSPAEIPGLAVRLREFDVIVDALGGTGIRGAPEGAVAIPTGLDCDSGRAPGAAIKAVVTVTFVATKKGFLPPEAAEYTGRMVVADIGIPAQAAARAVRGDTPNSGTDVKGA